jgi:hypothetical protein
MTASWTIGKFAVASAAVTLTGAAALLWLVLADPKPISITELGAEWQCTRTFVWTSCSRIRDTNTVVQSVRKDAPCPARRGLNG